MTEKEKFKPFRFWVGDVNWVEYGGTWVRLLGGRVFHFIEWMADEEMHTPTTWGWAQLAEVDLNKIKLDGIRLALSSCGWTLGEEGVVDSHSGDVVVPWGPDLDTTVAWACFSYGNKAIHEDVRTKAPNREIRALVQLSTELANDSAKRIASLHQPGNKLGSTKEEMMRGDIASAIHRGLEAGNDAAHLMYKVYMQPGCATLGGDRGIDVVHPPREPHIVLSEWESKFLGTNNPRMK